MQFGRLCVAGLPAVGDREIAGGREGVWMLLPQDSLLHLQSRLLQRCRLQQT